MTGDQGQAGALTKELADLQMRRWVAAWNAEDWEAVASFYAPEIVFSNEPPGWPERGPWHGIEQVMAQLRSASEAFRSHDMSVEVLAAEGQWQVCHQRWSGKGASSGLEFSRDWYLAVEVNADGKVIEIRYFETPEQAYSYSGLTPGA